MPGQVQCRKKSKRRRGEDDGEMAEEEGKKGEGERIRR